jgi:hypothetical protein
MEQLFSEAENRNHFILSTHEMGKYKGGIGPPKVYQFAPQPICPRRHYLMSSITILVLKVKV